MTKTAHPEATHPFLKGCLLIGGILLLFCPRCPAQSPNDPQPPIDDIRDIMTDRPPATIVPLILGIIAAVVVLVVIILAFRRFLRKRPEIQAPPPEFVARNRLRKISGRVDELEPNKASLETSEAVKDFLTAQYQDPIRFETAEEYLDRITHPRQDAPARLSPALTEQVQSFVTISQELKFARIREARSKIPALIKQAETIIGMSVREKVSKKR